jgi:hypothetical protein
MYRRVINFSGQEETISQGRSGSIKTTGIEVFKVDGFPLKLSPITRRGTVANCYIEIELRAIPELIEALQEAQVKILAGRAGNVILDERDNKVKFHDGTGFKEIRECRKYVCQEDIDRAVRKLQR